MKKSFIGFSILLACSCLGLSACGSDSHASKNVFSYVYQSDPDTLDYTLSSRTTTSNITSNLIDGLLENDAYGNFVPSIAEDWSVSKDGKTYTYKLRKDAQWVTAEGEVYAPVRAQDFLTGLKHAADSKTESDYLIKDSIKGLAAYMDGQDPDFSHVGIKAPDDHTLIYELNQPEPFWNSKTTNGVLFPINEDFLKSKGDAFASTHADSLLYNGPFILKNLTAKSEIQLEKNPHYWDKDHVYLDHVKLSYFDGQDVDSLIRNFSSSAYSQARLYPNSSNYSAAEKEFADQIIYEPQDATTFYYSFNVDRAKYDHTAKQTDEQKEATKKAILNKNFRQAINFAFNRTALAAQGNGEKGASKILRNSLVPPSFVQSGHHSFGQLVEKELEGLDDQWKGVDLSDGQDAFYNKEKAKEAMGRAQAELEVQGVTFPIHLDLPVDQTNQINISESSSFKQSVEESLGADKVVIDLIKMPTEEYDQATFFAQTGNQKDYDLQQSGWGPDYQDPSTYLDILDPRRGANLQNIGLEAGISSPVFDQLGLYDYQNLLDAANKEETKEDKRYESYAKAQAWLTDASILLPFVSKGGTPKVSRVRPFTAPFSLVGTKGSDHTFKYLQVDEQAISSQDYEKALSKYLKAKEDSNDRAQKELANHQK